MANLAKTEAANIVRHTKTDECFCFSIQVSGFPRSLIIMRSRTSHMYMYMQLLWLAIKASYCGVNETRLVDILAALSQAMLKLFTGARTSWTSTLPSDHVQEFYFY